MVRYLSFAFIITITSMFVDSCKHKVKQSVVSTGNDYNKNGLNKHFDWTGTYILEDSEAMCTLKLHKRSVDGSYEMQFYDNSRYVDLYKSSVYDAKDDSGHIYIRYLNNFMMDAKPLGFESGDTLFYLQKRDTGFSSVFKAFKPKNNNSCWKKINSTY